MRILSLGAGVQSSTIALMIVHGEIEPVSCGIFADTQCEPSYVYDWLDRLESILTFPVYRVSRGNLGQDFLDALKIETTVSHHAQPPMYVRSPENDGTANQDPGGLLRRHCTEDYKLNVIRAEGRRLMKVAGDKHIDQLIGISLDEAHRMKDSRVQYITNLYPLIDLRMKRVDCLRWLDNHGYQRPEKSACVFCPYRSNANWVDMRTRWPMEFAKAVDYDNQLRIANDRRLRAGIKGELFVHRSMRPLSEHPFDRADRDYQLELFGNECEGMCGV